MASFSRAEMWTLALWMCIYLGWCFAGSHITPPQVPRTLKEILGRWQQTQPTELLWKDTKTFCLQKSLGGHPYYSPLSSGTQCIQAGQTETSILFGGLLPHGISRGDGIFCLLVSKEKIYLVPAVLMFSLMSLCCVKLWWIFSNYNEIWNQYE